MTDKPKIWSNSGAVRANRSMLLSICIPVFNFNAVELVAALTNQARPYSHNLEIVVADDASDDRRNVERMQETVNMAETPTRLFMFSQNQGRSRIRQFLTEQAAGTYVLFLDCDMQPDDSHFVARYFELAARGQNDVVVGGCSYNRLGAVPRSCRLYYLYSARTQCAPVAIRARHPLRYAFTNNIMIRRELLSRLPFDAGYIGWGYEDTDLAFRLARTGGNILHIENTATHCGLIDDNALVEKYRQSVPNFLRLIQKFPSEAGALPISRVSRRFSVLPFPFGVTSKALAALVRSAPIPIRLRYPLFQGYRLALYCHAIRTQGQAVRPAST